MPLGLEFVEAAPQAAAQQLTRHAIHVWRIPYAPSQGRAPLLAMLAAYLGIPSSQVVLDQNPKGKPHLQPVRARSSQTPRHEADERLSFNWSHSGDYALIALARGEAVGVDIERLGKPLRALEIAQRFFDPAEAAALAALDPGVRDQAFIGLWCAKEAVLKAVGEGLSFGLARLAFERRDAGEWELARVDPVLGGIGDWQFSGFDAAPGYRGALAWLGGVRKIHAFRPA